MLEDEDRTSSNAEDIAPLERGRELERGRDLERRSWRVGVVVSEGGRATRLGDDTPGEACRRNRCFICSTASAVGCRDTGLPYLGLPVPVKLDEIGEPWSSSGSGDRSLL